MTSTNNDKEKLHLEHEQLVEKARSKEAQKLQADKDTLPSKQPKNYNAILDNEQYHCTVEFIPIR